MTDSMYDLTIIGGGPAGVAAGVYASRKRLKTAFVTDSFGGQSEVSTDIQNWIGTPSISGNDLAKNLEEHLTTYAGDILDVFKGERAETVEKIEPFHFKTKTKSGKEIESKAVLVTTGSHRRKLDIPGAEKFDNKGVTYCASCDGPLFAGQDVVVVGGGNAGLETAMQLLAYTTSVTLLHRRDEFKGDPVTVEKLQKNEKFTGITNAEPVKIQGEAMVEAVVYKDMQTGETHELKASGVFVEIGLVPNTSFVEDIVELSEYKQIVIDPWTQQASEDGLWAAGDCTNVLYHQNNIAAGDGVRALEDVYKKLFA
ncbi:MAG: FAD-dependent oxidoreductase [Candidatus Paceibacterota bacterium]